MPVTSLILSRLDCCNSVLSGLPASSVHSRRRIQNCAARLIPILRNLTLSFLSFSLSIGSQSQKEIITR